MISWPIPLLLPQFQKSKTNGLNNKTLQIMGKCYRGGDNRPAWFFLVSRGRGHRQQTLRCKVKCQKRSGSLSSSFYAPNKYHYLTVVQWPIFMTCIGINIVTDNTEDVSRVDLWRQWHSRATDLAAMMQPYAPRDPNKLGRLMVTVNFSSFPFDIFTHLPCIFDACHWIFC